MQKPVALLLVLLMISTCFWSNRLHAEDVYTQLGTISRNWINRTVVPATPRQPAKTAILIIAPARNGTSFTEKRWAIGRKTWEHYMTSHPAVDCFFLQTAPRRKTVATMIKYG